MNIKFVFFLFFILFLIPACEKSIEYDIVILNGRVMDPETNFDAVRNVGIKDGIISIITEKDISGKETIDAKG
jgi:N-acyl-D-aspartate/D-glutamate deacylase